MNFKEGGRRYYAMVGPEGEEHWSIQDFTAIAPKTNFKFLDAFTDKEERINPEMPGSTWNLVFNETEGITTVNISIRHKTLADLENILNMGFQEGVTITLDHLEQLLTK